MASITDALQAVLTQGINAAAAVAQTKLQVQSPTGIVTGPNGQRSLVGQTSYGITQTVAGLAPLLVIGGIGLVAVLVLPRLFGKR